jgi:hypothetical protein
MVFYGYFYIFSRLVGHPPPNFPANTQVFHREPSNFSISLLKPMPSLTVVSPIS